MSHGTIRRALAELRNRNLVRSDQGRNSFVTFHDQPLDDRQGRVESLCLTGTEMTVKTLSITKIDEPSLTDYLDGQPTVIEIVRTRSLPSGTVVSPETSLPPSIRSLADLPRHGLIDDSITKTLNNAGLASKHGEQLADLVALDEKSAPILKPKPGKPVMHITRTSLTNSNNLVEHVTSLLDPDHFRFRNVF